MENIYEASLSRVWQHAQGDRDFAIISASRGKFSTETNNARNKKMAGMFKNAGWGYFWVDGFWIENEGTPQEIHVKENSLFVISNGKSDFENYIKACAELFNQDGYIIKNKNGIFLVLLNENKRINIGQFHPDKVAQAYTKLHGRGGRTFVLEGIKEDKGNLRKYLDSLEEKV